MTPPPGLYSGKSTIAMVARVSAVSLGLVYGSLKLKYLKMTKPMVKHAAAAEHH